ncbi:hypothetical protein E2C01_091503 [Portunus trituberculatus]|uniref:Uncharacterized protein n=1 Tax=Portunus trituberculatus TaxID=210409 RepID=A0A5B7JNR9_PORTR|nr:hypothetical protein [Portunus trituberculatus]
MDDNKDGQCREMKARNGNFSERVERQNVFHFGS